MAQDECILFTAYLHFDGHFQGETGLVRSPRFSLLVEVNLQRSVACVFYAPNDEFQGTEENTELHFTLKYLMKSFAIYLCPQIVKHVN